MSFKEGFNINSRSQCFWKVPDMVQVSEKMPLAVGARIFSDSLHSKTPWFIKLTVIKPSSFFVKLTKKIFVFVLICCGRAEVL